MPIAQHSATLATDPAPPAVPSPDDVAGMAWFNSIHEIERAYWLAAAGSARPVDAWREFKRSREPDGGIRTAADVP